MVWNKNRPADSDKIRISAALIRDNWEAIEEGGVPFDYLTLEKQAVAPTSATGYGHLYGFDIGGKTELTYQTDDGVSSNVKLTQAGRLGATGQNGVFSVVTLVAFSFDDLFVYAATNMIPARGSVSSSGVVSRNINLSSSRTSTGSYTITIPAGVLTTDSYQVIATPFQTGGGTTIILDIISKSTVNPALPTVITLFTKERSGGAHTDAAFEVIIIGGR